MVAFNLFEAGFWQQWFRVAKTSNNSAQLTPRQIYILPTRWGILYAVMLLLLLVGSINYSISLGYYVTFLLTSLGNMVMLQTWRNLVHLQITIQPAEPVFAGSTASVPIQLFDTKARQRFAINAKFEGNLASDADITSNGTHTILVPLQTQQRGLLTLPRLQLFTEFPMALLHAWAYVDSSHQMIVYPKPNDNNSLPTFASDAQMGINSHIARGDDDFDGHKTYQIGDAPSRVDWKASSRGLGMFSKQYSGLSGNIVLLNWEDTEGDFEARISQLTRWVVDANAANQQFGLVLPNLNLAPDQGAAHYHQALTALALL